MILSRQLTPGLRVTQTELADMLGVSTMPIREALLRLGSEGLIISSANRSFEVAHPTEKGIRDVYWIHGVLAANLQHGRETTNLMPSSPPFSEILSRPVDEVVSGDLRFG
jgi:DNA-binding GntR family transcriptional regulator